MLYQPLVFIIVAEDALANLFTSWLKESHIESKIFNSLTATSEFYIQQPAVIFIDLKLINSKNQQIITSLQESGIPIILLAQYSNYDIVIKNNYFEICPLPVEKERFNLLISNALNCYNLILENRQMRKELYKQNEVNRFLTRDDQVIHILQACNKLNDNEILAIFGETGCGKSTLIDFIIEKNNIQNFNLIKFSFQNENDFLERLNRLQETYQYSNKKLILEITTPFPEWDGWNDIINKVNKFKTAEVFTLPPLRERLKDIKFYLSNYIDRIRFMGLKNVAGISTEAEMMLIKHEWRRNLIEFYDVIKKAIELSNTDHIEETDIAMVLNKHSTARSGDSIIINDIISMEEYKKKIVNYAYKKCEGNIFEAANKLKLGRATLYRLLHKYNII